MMERLKRLFSPGMWEQVKRALRTRAALSFAVCCAALFLVQRGHAGGVLVFLAIDAAAYLLIGFIVTQMGRVKKRKEWIAGLVLLAVVALYACSPAIRGLGALIEGRAASADLSWLVIVVHLLAVWVPALAGAAGQYGERRRDAVVPALAMAEGVCDLFVRRGLDRFLMRDYAASVSFSRWDRAEEGRTRDKLNALMRDMLRFLELPPLVRLSVEYGADDSPGRTQAGSYQRGAYDRTIQVRIQPWYKPSHIAAILCHECTHYFMEHHELNWNDTGLNERRTDVVANLIGFSRIMSRGYQEVEQVKVSGNWRTTTTHKIGYITYEECTALGEFLKERRERIVESQAEAQVLDGLRREFESHLEVAKTLAGQLELIDPAAVKAGERFEEVRRVFMERESRDIPAEIRRHEEMGKRALNASQAAKENEALDQLCADLITWLTILRGEGAE